MYSRNFKLEKYFDKPNFLDEVEEILTKHQIPEQLNEAMQEMEDSDSVNMEIAAGVLEWAINNFKIRKSQWKLDKDLYPIHPAPALLYDLNLNQHL